MKRQRLFVAALGNDTLEVVDLKSGRRERSLGRFGEPQGVLYLPEFNRLYVANASANRVDILQPIGEDTDDLFFDPERKRVYVICGEGRIDIVRHDDPDNYSLEGTVRTAPRARTGLFVPEEGRLYVAAPATGKSPARVVVYRVR